MAVIPTPVLPPRTGLWGLGFQFEQLGYRFNALYNDIKDIWLIGAYLALPFYIVSLGFFIARDKAWDADSLIVTINAWIKHLTESTGILDILKVLSYNIRFMVDDPIGFVTYYVKLVSTPLRNIMENANQWYRNKLQFNFPNLWTIMFDTLNWLRDRIYQLFPGLVTFFMSPIPTVLGWIRYEWPYIPKLISDPVGQIVDWLSSRFPGFVSFLQYPTNYIIDRLTMRTPTLGEFLITPLTWLKRQVGLILNISVADFDNFPLAIIQSILRMINIAPTTLLDRITTIFCDIVLSFI